MSEYSWNYIAIKRKSPTGDTEYVVGEHYPMLGFSLGPEYAVGDTKEELIQDLQNMIDDIKESPEHDDTKEQDKHKPGRQS